MKMACLEALVIVMLSVSARVTSLNTSDANVDPVTAQLPDYKMRTPIPGVLTTSAGRPVDVSEARTLGRSLATNLFALEAIKHAVSERRPDRPVFAKAIAAKGVLEVKHDVTRYTKAKLFEHVGKVTPLIARFSTSQIQKGGNDAAPYTARGLSIKFYTEEGNLDLLGFNVPVYFYREPIGFVELLHALGLNPQTNLLDISATVDMATLSPVMLHMLLWSLSERGLPRGFRRMSGHPLHTYELYNDQGEVFYARFRFQADLPYESISLEQAAALNAYDPDLFIRDLYNSIERQNYPTWTFEMDVLNDDLDQVTFDPFDLTKIWPNGTFTTVEIGTITLNRNVDNAFAENEDLALYPGNLVPGINPPHDQVFAARMYAYFDSQINRLGSNYNKIEVNRPLYARTFTRDGAPPLRDNEGDRVNYYGSSFHGARPVHDPDKPDRVFKTNEVEEADYEACRRFYNEVMATDAQKNRLVKNMVLTTLRAHHSLQLRLLELLSKVDADFAKRYEVTLDLAKAKVRLPQTVDDVDPNRLNPYADL